MASVALRGGIDLGGTKIQAVVVDAGHEVRGQARRETPATGGPAGVVAALADALGAAAAQAGVATSDLIGVGVGAPGAIDAAAGTLARAGNLPGWHDPQPLAADLGGRVGAPVQLGNDVQVATDAELALGAGRGARSLLGVFWGTGVGGGIVLDGRPWLGRGAAGEIGHVVVQPGGERCPCGRVGCLEAYAGRRAMEDRARRARDAGEPTALFTIMEERGKDRLTAGVWARALKHDDPVATRLVADAIAALGVGVASACNLLDVEVVVVGGGVGVKLGEPYAARIRDAMLPHLFADDRPPAVRVAALGDLGGAIGASLLVERAA